MRDWISAAAAAKRLGVHPSTFKKTADAAQFTRQVFPGTNIVRYRVDDVEQLARGTSAKHGLAEKARAS